jgi:hypothetical protein
LLDGVPVAKDFASPRTCSMESGLRGRSSC